MTNLNWELIHEILLDYNQLLLGFSVADEIMLSFDV